MCKSQQSQIHEDKLTEYIKQSSRKKMSVHHFCIGLCLWLCIGLIGCGTTPKTGITHPQKNSLSSTEKQRNHKKQQSDHKLNHISQHEAKLEFQEPLPADLSQSCVQAQTKLYQKAMKSTQEYTQVFMHEIGKLKLHFQGFQLSTRRSQMMIFFGNGLIKRLSMIETISDCLPLYTQYLKDREQIFQTVEKSIKAQNH